MGLASGHNGPLERKCSSSLLGGSLGCTGGLLGQRPLPSMTSAGKWSVQTTWDHQVAHSGATEDPEEGRHPCGTALSGVGRRGAWEHQAGGGVAPAGEGASCVEQKGRDHQTLNRGSQPDPEPWWCFLLNLPGSSLPLFQSWLSFLLFGAPRC